MDQKEKQIEETIEFLNNRINVERNSYFGKGCITIPLIEAEKILDILKGYRKQSEVAKEIFEKIDRITMQYLDDKDYTAGEMVYDLDNFKHEYMKGGEG